MTIHGNRRSGARLALVCVLLAGAVAPLAAAPRPQDDAERNSVQEQRALLRRAERLKALMEQLAKRYEAEGRAYFVNLLREGLQHLDQSGVLQEMNAAGIALEKSLTNRALEAQTKILDNLDRLLAILMDRRSVEDLQADAERAQQQIEELQRLSDRERKVRERIEGLREEARTERERQLMTDLRSLAGQQRRQAASNAGESTPLQDEMERTLAEIQALKGLEDQLAARLRPAADNQQAADSARALATLQDLIKRLEAVLSGAQEQRTLDAATNDLQAMLRNDEQRPPSAEARRAAADRLQRLAAQPAGHEPATDAGRAEREALNKALAKAAQDLRAATPAQPAEAEAATRAALEPALEALRSAAKENAARSAAAERQMAAAGKRMAEDMAKSAAQPSAGDKPADLQRKLDGETAKDLEQGAAELDKAAEELERGVQAGSPQEALPRATSRAQAALRHLHAAASRQLAKSQSPESLARQFTDRARQAGQDLASVAGGDETAKQATESLEAAAKAMDQARAAIAGQQQSPEAAGSERARTASEADRQAAREALARAEQALQGAVERSRGEASTSSQAAAERQRQLTEQAKQMRQALDEAAKAGAIAPEQQSAARQPLDKAVESMQRGEQELARGSPRAGARSQAEAANKIDEAAENLRQSRPLGPEEQRALADLAKRQRELNQEILELAKRIDEKKNREARQRTQQAASSGQKAAEQMEAGEAEESEEQAHDAENKLEEAKEELAKERDRYLKLRQEELLFRITDEIKQLIEKQDDISKKTAEITEAQSDGARMPRSVRSKLRELGNLEAEMAKRTRFLADELKKEQTLVFTYVLESVAEDLEQLAQSMGASTPSAGPELRGLQDEVSHRLKSLLAALTEELRRKKQEREEQQQQPGDQQSTNEGQQRPRLVPDVAELKMLRRLEIDARERIEEFQRLRARMPEGFETWAKNSLNRLALRHAKVTDLLLEFVRTRGIGDAHPPAKGGEEPPPPETKPGSGKPGSGKEEKR